MNSVKPPWRDSLERAIDLHAHLPMSHFLQMATVRADGLPANRTLTFRFFLSGDRLLFSADSRTKKIAQLQQNPWAEACWYFSESRLQFRLLGRMQVVLDTDAPELMAARSRTWQERSDSARQSFTWPPAGEPLAQRAAYSHPAPALPPATFTMLVFSPMEVGILDLSRQPHAHTAFLREETGWHAKEINP